MKLKKAGHKSSTKSPHLVLIMIAVIIILVVMAVLAMLVSGVDTSDGRARVCYKNANDVVYCTDNDGKYKETFYNGKKLGNCADVSKDGHCVVY